MKTGNVARRGLSADIKWKQGNQISIGNQRICEDKERS